MKLHQWARTSKASDARTSFARCPGYRNPLKLRREPDEFWTEPRKPSRKVTLPKLKFLERPADE